MSLNRDCTVLGVVFKKVSYCYGDKVSFIELTFGGYNIDLGEPSILEKCTCINLIFRDLRQRQHLLSFAV